MSIRAFNEANVECSFHDIVMKCRFDDESVGTKSEAGKSEEKRKEIGFDGNVHFVTLSRSADSKRSRSDQNQKQANPKRSEEKSVLMRMFIS